MKLEPKVPEEDIEVDMSPMIDMVFLLLIFFLVAAAAIETKVNINEIPDAIYAKVAEDQTGRFVISVKDDGKIYAGIDGVNDLTIDELKEELQAAFEADENIRVLIRADSYVKYKVNEEIMTACAEVGVNDLIFSAFEESGVKL